MKITLTIFGVLLLSAGAFAQDKSGGTGNIPPEKAAAIAAPKVTITAQSTPLELAKAAQAAHGGDKFKNLKSLLIRGSADLSAPNSTQTIPANFFVVTSGDRSRFEINSQMAPITQIFDGVNLYNSFPQIQIPPMSRVTVGLLQMIDNKSYLISALPDKKKKRAFKITTPDGFTTDFYIDAVTGLVDTIEAKFTSNGREITTAISIDKFREVEGVMVPEKFSQRIDFAGMAAFGTFKAKEILINSELPENTFVIPQ